MLLVNVKKRKEGLVRGMKETERISIRIYQIEEEKTKKRKT